MRLIPKLTILAAFAGAFAAAHVAGALEGGQGPIEGDAENVRLSGMDLGEYWYGQETSQEDLVGKVVLVEMWGS